MPLRFSKASSPSLSPSPSLRSRASSSASSPLSMPSKALPTSAQSYLQAMHDGLTLRHPSSPSSSSSSSLSTRDIVGGKDSPSIASSRPASTVAPKDASRIIPSRSFDPDPYWVPDPSDPNSLRHAEFGFDDDPAHRYTSQWRGAENDKLGVNEEEPSYWVYLITYISYLILIVVGHVRDFFGKRTHRKAYEHLMEHNVCFVSVCFCPSDLLTSPGIAPGIRGSQFRF
jgi:serine palmitoyltransferase